MNFNPTFFFLTIFLPGALFANLESGKEQDDNTPWWKTAVLYQVYPRSFKDSDGSGVGDLKGIIGKVNYFKELGVSAIWISPIFDSPMADFGYDIRDYKSIDPTFGTLKDFNELKEKLRSLDIKLLLDFIPNHTSDEHKWFQKSVQKIPPYTDYYIWHDGKIDPDTKNRIPPSNWLSEFSGSTWEWNEQRKQYYLHHFGKKQPDLNYRNKRVLEEMDGVIRYWLDLGVDGFRVDAVPYLIEDEKFRDDPPVEGTEGSTFFEQIHKFSQNQPETKNLLDHWADIVLSYIKKDGRQRVLFLEAYADLQITLDYYGQGPHSFMQPFNFQLLEQGKRSIRAGKLRKLILSWINLMPEGNVANWAIGNHDKSRVADRYGPEAVDAMNLLTGVLPGIKVTYNGEEIGMRNTFIRWDQTVDIGALPLGPKDYMETSRDPFRTPMQWDSSVSAGFSSNKKTWLPVNPNYWYLNVQAQKSAAQSHLKVFQAMTAARSDPILRKGKLRIEVPDKDTLIVVRSLNKENFVFIFNMGTEIAEYTKQNKIIPKDLIGYYKVVAASVHSEITTGTKIRPGSFMIKLRPRAAVLLRTWTSYF